MKAKNRKEPVIEKPLTDYEKFIYQEYGLEAIIERMVNRKGIENERAKKRRSKQSDPRANRSDEKMSARISL